MNKREAESDFKKYCLPWLPLNDKSAKRQAWNDYVDSLQKSGRVTAHQAETWQQPRFIRS